MNKRQRVQNVLVGILMIACAVLMALHPGAGYDIVTAILSITLLLGALKKLIYYFTMARFMVGGGMILCKGLIQLDMALLVSWLNDVPNFYVMLYLIIGLLFAGVVDVLMAFESRKLETSWKLKFAQGALTLILSVIALICVQSVTVAVYVFCVSIIQSATIRIIESFRKTAIIYIQ